MIHVEIVIHGPSKSLVGRALAGHIVVMLHLDASSIAAKYTGTASLVDMAGQTVPGALQGTLQVEEDERISTARDFTVLPWDDLKIMQTGMYKIHFDIWQHAEAAGDAKLIQNAVSRPIVVRMPLPTSRPTA